MKVDGHGFSVVGMGVSGVSAANALARRGGDVIVSDRGDDDAVRQSATRLDPGVRRSFGGEVVRSGDVAVLSPGIPPSSPAFEMARAEAAEVIGEVELFFRLYEGPVVAVTGTDGKSTVTTLLAHLLNTAGVGALAGGNLGNPLCDILDDAGPGDVVVAEVSCFQLITTSTFRPFVAVVTNLAEDHIEYHGSYDAYIRAKAMVAGSQGPGDWFVRNLDDPLLKAWMEPGNGTCPPRGQALLDVSVVSRVSNGAFFEGGDLWLARGGSASRVCPRSGFPLPGGHNTENALLALAASRPFDPDPARLAEGLSTYSGLPHRLELVRTVGGVRVYNDSKATNPHATVTALRAFDEKVVLIAGGHEKGLSYDDLVLEIDRCCSHVILVGESAERMAREFPDEVPVEVVDDHETAARHALALAAPSGTVLFSPAASSFDRFGSFEERGDVFREIVSRL